MVAIKVASLRRHVYTYAKSTLPITRDEFAAALLACRPPTGWGHSLAVANSGGPDSTSLLFLLKRWVDEHQHLLPEHSPMRVVSLSVDHQMQAASKAMEAKTAKLAQSIGVEHINRVIDWDADDIPHFSSSKAENLARLARYHLLYSGMVDTNSKIIAFGHHADDQVETSLIRLSKGSGMYGAAGMKPLRRWGMGVSENPGELGYTGHESMNSWMIRPLLPFSKDRLLATCDANGLDYVVDKTNFMPTYALRNAIRGFIESGESDAEARFQSSGYTFTNTAQVYCKRVGCPASYSVDMRRAISRLFHTDALSVQKNATELRDAVSKLATDARALDAHVDDLLAQLKSPFSPVGTFVLDMQQFVDLNEELKTRLISRITRYVSPFPWGSIHSTNKNSSDRTKRIIRELDDPFKTPSIVAGSAVRWTPIIINCENTTPLPEDTSPETTKIDLPYRRGGIAIPTRTQSEELLDWRSLPPHMKVGWLISRQPPFSRLTDDENPVIMDLTERMRAHLAEGREKFELLWDGRYVVSVDMSQLPVFLRRVVEDEFSLHRVMVLSGDRYFNPYVALETQSKYDLLAEVEEDDGSGREVGVKRGVLHNVVHVDPSTVLPGQDTILEQRTKRPRRETQAPWVRLTWIRPLTG
ncbi:hypothetical protein CYLTODRAFT_487572 [Cylindrobasidium torrendii FP15055 ss-10]|uniref:tRNA(Ile)-lysidine synthetase n=1 Tax=Cylindrobasidium torrendii FP15055 ss-10 TaxID=1314674 RepID=A0A0D7BKR6_9AGAR|nr:hypothetical protein CYLTODRAFT_487572 [Cylindrobasidium torrendii FP15055 ss-10]